MPIDDYVMPRLEAVSRVVWNKLGVTELSAPQEQIGDVFRVLMAKMFKEFLSLQPALDAGLSEPDSYLFNYGIGTYMCAILKPGMPKIQPETPLVAVKAGDDAWKYANPTATSQSREEDLQDEAWEWLRAMDCFVTDWSFAEQPILQRAGNRRTARVQLGVPSTNPLYRIYSNDLTAWQWESYDALYGHGPEY